MNICQSVSLDNVMLFQGQLQGTPKSCRNTWLLISHHSRRVWSDYSSADQSVLATFTCAEANRTKGEKTLTVLLWTAPQKEVVLPAAHAPGPQVWPEWTSPGESRSLDHPGSDSRCQTTWRESVNKTAQILLSWEKEAQLSHKSSTWSSSRHVCFIDWIPSL